MRIITTSNNCNSRTDTVSKNMMRIYKNDIRIRIYNPLTLHSRLFGINGSKQFSLFWIAWISWRFQKRFLMIRVLNFSLYKTFIDDNKSKLNIVLLLRREMIAGTVIRPRHPLIIKNKFFKENGVTGDGWLFPV
jgi:hypothetical protein